MKTQTVERIVTCGIVPVVRAPSAELATRAVDALVAGGIDVVEITMTVPGAVALIASLAGRYRDAVVVGAGSVLDADTARSCIAAGAAFVVSPVLDEATVVCCRSLGAAVMPGALTPTEIVHAQRAGADLIKVFPCGALGGASYVRSLLAPLPHLRLVPTGGVSERTIGDFIAAGAAAVGIGADLVDVAKIHEGNADSIRDAARRCVEEIQRARASRRPG